MQPIKYVYIQNFVFVGVSVIEILEFNQIEEEHGKTVKYHITKYYIGFTRFCRYFFNIIKFRHVLHFGVGRSQIEWNMKVKGQILICTAIMLNDHSNPYIESTTVLSDNNFYYNTDKDYYAQDSAQNDIRPQYSAASTPGI